MRILFLSQVIPFPLDAGAKIRSHYVIRWLAETGHDVTLVAFARPDDDPGHVAQMERTCREVHTVPMVRSRRSDAWHLARSLLRRQPFLIARDSVAAMHQKIGGLMSSTAFDAIHADQLWMAQYALAAARLAPARGRQAKLVLDQHNAMFLVPERLAAGSGWGLRRALLHHEANAMRRYEVATCARFDSVVWVTAQDRGAVAQAASALAPDRTNTLTDPVIPICVDTGQVVPLAPSPDACRVTFLGGLHWPPNAAGILWFWRQVWPQVLAQMPQARLTVIGKRPPSELGKVEAQTTGLEVTGYVADPAPYLAETAVFIVPLSAAGGMRVKILDAWTLGLPVVSTSIGAEGLRYEEGRDLLIADDADSFARSVVSLLRDRKRSRQVGAAGRRQVEAHYEWRGQYAAWDSIYSSSPN